MIAGNVCPPPPYASSGTSCCSSYGFWPSGTLCEGIYMGVLLLLAAAASSAARCL